jgi:hypothetical protein
MSPLDTVVRQALNELADSVPAPIGVAERAIRAHRRGWRMRLGAIVGAVAVTAMGVAAVLAPAGSSGPPAPRNVVYATQLYAGPGPRAEPVPWQILDPTTGRYRSAHVFSVSEPTADLRYAAVLPLFAHQDGTPLSPPNQIGRYESATGKIRWYDIPVAPGSDPAISPDGRYAAVLGWGHLVVVDLASGATRSTNLDRGVNLADQRYVPRRFEGGKVSAPISMSAYPLAWRSDSRHILVGDDVLDLNGQYVAELPIPAGTQLIASRQDRPGLLVSLSLDVSMFGATDERGVLVRGAEVRPGCAGCQLAKASWSARPDEVLLGAVNDTTHEWSIYTTELGSGKKTPPDLREVHHIGPNVSDFVLGSLTEPSDAPGAGTF